MLAVDAMQSRQGGSATQEAGSRFARAAASEREDKADKGKRDRTESRACHCEAWRLGRGLRRGEVDFGGEWKGSGWRRDGKFLARSAGVGCVCVRVRAYELGGAGGRCHSCDDGRPEGKRGDADAQEHGERAASFVALVAPRSLPTGGCAFLALLEQRATGHRHAGISLLLAIAVVIVRRGRARCAASCAAVQHVCCPRSTPTIRSQPTPTHCNTLQHPPSVAAGVAWAA